MRNLILHCNHIRGKCAIIIIPFQDILDAIGVNYTEIIISPITLYRYETIFFHNCILRETSTILDLVFIICFIFLHIEYVAKLKEK